MIKTNTEDIWISLVKHNNSDSKDTENIYRKNLESFCEFIKISPNGIYEEWKQCETNRNMQNFVEKYKFLMVEYMDNLSKNGYAKMSILQRISSVKSFFNYMDMPFSKTIKPKGIVTFHNRDIKIEELVKIIRHTKHVRDKAVFSMMAQSGLRPITISKLRYEHIKEDYEKETIPCRIIIPQGIAKGKYRGYYTFVGKDTIEFLKDYFETRKKLNDDSLLFTNLYKTNEAISRKSISREFHQIIMMLGLAKGEFNKPRDIRLYSLRKWFRNKTSSAGLDYVHFWMGHTLPMNDEHYRSFEDIEEQRKKYAEVMDNLKLFVRSEEPSSESAKTLTKELDKQAKEILRLKELLESTEIQHVLRFMEKSQEERRKIEAEEK